jgi:hypothetical protein
MICPARACAPKPFLPRQRRHPSQKTKPTAHARRLRRRLRDFVMFYSGKTPMFAQPSRRHAKI